MNLINPMTVSPKNVPVLSKRSKKALEQAFSPSKQKVQNGNVIETKEVSYNFYELYEIIKQIETYKKSCMLREEIEKTPIKAKVLSLLAVGLMLAIIVGGSLGAHYANKFITTAHDANIAATVGIVGGTIITANVVGTLLNNRWRGITLYDGTNYVDPIIAPFCGIITPLWRVFGSKMQETAADDYNSVNQRLTKTTYDAILGVVNSKENLNDRETLKKELKAVYDFFSQGIPISQKSL